MTRPSAAIAVFVKTPGLSPIKTRLAAGIGPEQSAEFYRLAIASIGATVAAVANSTGAIPYWAVAEEAGLEDPQWREFERIAQAAGDLGDRLHTVFAKLQSRHTAVIAMGADSPQLTPAILESAVSLLVDSRSVDSHVLGRAHDGGFYLVGSKLRLPPQTWSEVPYSKATTAEILADNLRVSGQIAELDRLTDVDQAEDLITLEKELHVLDHLTTEQLALLAWIERDIPPASRERQ